MKEITVLLAEDHAVVREGYRSMLKLEADFHVVGEAQDGREAVALAGKFKPDVVLMDIAMPHLNGLEATRQIVRAHPSIKVLILSAHNDDAYVDTAIASGAVGFLLKQASSIDVCQTIREVQQGKHIFSPTINRRMNRFQPPSQSRSGQLKKKVAQLTSREMEVLQLIAEGMANKQIAGDLKISTKTVEKHRQHLMEKLDIHDTASLTRYAISAGIIESSVQLTIITPGS
jgi:DNA-binding NarL/FixJ family response regulator